MTTAALITNADVTAFLSENAIPKGYAYTIVNISVNKRLLRDDMPAKERLDLLESLEVSRDDLWLTPKMIATIEPMCDKGNEIVSEARRLDASKILDVFADHFSTFAVLNPSLIAALRMLPGCRAKAA
jgi:hypothetical protein